MRWREVRAGLLALAGALVLATLSACSEPKKLGEGKRVAPPGGYYSLCRNQPDSPLCRQK